MRVSWVTSCPSAMTEIQEFSAARTTTVNAAVSSAGAGVELSKERMVTSPFLMILGAEGASDVEVSVGAVTGLAAVCSTGGGVDRAACGADVANGALTFESCGDDEDCALGLEDREADFGAGVVVGTVGAGTGALGAGCETAGESAEFAATVFGVREWRIHQRAAAITIRAAIAMRRRGAPAEGRPPRYSFFGGRTS